MEEGEGGVKVREERVEGDEGGEEVGGRRGGGGRAEKDRRREGRRRKFNERVKDLKSFDGSSQVAEMPLLCLS